MSSPPAIADVRQRWPYGFVLGLGFFGVTAIGPIYNTYVPLILDSFGLSSAAVGFVMGWDNWLLLFIPAWVGAWSDRHWTRLGRRKPWILAGAPIAILLYALIPLLPSLAGLLLVLLATNLALAVIRAPGLALLGDLFAPAERSKASGVINLLGGLGAVTALVGSGIVYSRVGPAMPFVLGSLILLGSTLVFALAVHERQDWGRPTMRAGSSPWTRLAAIVRGHERDSALIFLATFFAFVAYDSLETWMSSYGHFGLGLDPDQLPYLLATFAGALLAAAIPAGFLGARLGQRKTVGLGMALLTLLFALGMFVRSPATLPWLLALAGCGWALIIANLYPLLYAVAGEGSIGMFTGLYYTVTSLAAIVGPSLIGVLLDGSGQDFRVMWATAAAAMAVGVTLLVLSRRDGGVIRNA